MVLLGTSTLALAPSKSRAASRRRRIFINEVINALTLSNIFINLCAACHTRTMACIPPSAFSAGRIRETQRDRDMKLSNTGKLRSDAKFFDTSLLELNPVKYNSKLMNSIWGIYNRYSPHNVKKINDTTFSFNVDLQQSAANSTNKNEQARTSPLPAKKLDSMWAALNLSQSH